MARVKCFPGFLNRALARNDSIGVHKRQSQGAHGKRASVAAVAEAA